jgi:hypothetical protein
LTVTAEKINTGSLGFWFGQFERGTPDRTKLSSFVDRLMKNNLTMSEKAFYSESLVGYYEQVTGDCIKGTPEFQKLFDWIREGYDPGVYVFYSDAELQRLRKKYEPKSIEQRDEVPEKYRLNGRRKKCFAHDINFDYEKREKPTTLEAQRLNFKPPKPGENFA